MYFLRTGIAGFLRTGIAGFFLRGFFIFYLCFCQSTTRGPTLATTLTRQTQTSLISPAITTRTQSNNPPLTVTTIVQQAGRPSIIIVTITVALPDTTTRVGAINYTIVPSQSPNSTTSSNSSGPTSSGLSTGLLLVIIIGSIIVGPLLLLYCYKTWSFMRRPKEIKEKLNQDEFSAFMNDTNRISKASLNRFAVRHSAQQQAESVASLESDTYSHTSYSINRRNHSSASLSQLGYAYTPQYMHSSCPPSHKSYSPSVEYAVVAAAAPEQRRETLRSMSMSHLPPPSLVNQQPQDDLDVIVAVQRHSACQTIGRSTSPRPYSKEEYSNYMNNLYTINSSDSLMARPTFLQSQRSYSSSSAPDSDPNSDPNSESSLLPHQNDTLKKN